MATFKERLEEAIRLRDISPAELSRRSGVNEGAISQYRSGAYKASQRSLEKLSNTLNVSIPWLMGADVPMEQPSSRSSADIPDGFIPMPEMRKIPLVGSIACGTPILAEENIEDYVDIPRHIRADYALACEGDSMVGAGIRDGDIVYIRKQTMVESGQIAAVRIDNEATLKRFYRKGDTVTLVAENPSFEPLLFVGEEINDITIEGLAVAYTHKLVK